MAIPGYRILRKIRQGGMSTVYLAIQKSVEREVAIKVMSPTLSSDPSYGSRFYREAKIVGQLSHPNIVSIYDVGSYKHYNYIAMDYLPGAPLQDKLKQGITTDEAVKITREIASALDYAHSRGYVHRDIKPDNILFRSDGSAVLCDFGIAKATQGATKMTQLGSVMGTPQYMSPEQAQGQEVDGRADLYSLGVVLYEMLAGHTPYQGDDPVAIAVKHISAPIPKLPAEHKVFQPIINRLMAKNPSARFQNGNEIIQAIDNIQTKIDKNSSHYLTQTQSTAIQVANLVRALLFTLASSLAISIKRLIGLGPGFKNHAVQLSEQQLADIDKFVLDEGDEEYGDKKLFHDTGPIPVTREMLPRKTSRKPALIMLVSIIGIAAGLFALLDQPFINGQASTDNTTADTSPPATAANEHATAGPEQTTANAQPRYALTIKTTPTNASVRILNIKPKYEAGMLLQQGVYHIEVSATDYFKQRLWLTIADSDIEKTVALKPTRRLLPAGTQITDTLADGSAAPTMVVLPKQTDKPVIAVGIHEITFDQYEHFARATQRALPDDASWGRGNQPVIGISFQEANAYAQWLSAQTKQHYRLPSAEEWEYAARGGIASDYWWEEENAEKKANCRRGCDSQWSKLFGSSTAPIKSFQANPYGLYDTAGNVAEWINQCAQWNSQQTQCTKALAAGGSHRDSVKQITSNSFAETSTTGNRGIGFRLLLEL